MISNQPLISNHFLICALINDEIGNLRPCKTKILYWFVCTFIKILIIRSLESTSVAARLSNKSNTPRADSNHAASCQRKQHAASGLGRCMHDIKEATKIRNLCDDSRLLQTRGMYYNFLRSLKVIIVNSHQTNKIIHTHLRSMKNLHQYEIIQRILK